MSAPFPATGTHSLGNFVPEIWSKKLQAKFYAKSILPLVSNTDYEGEISDAGNKVKIRTVPAVTINDYTGTVTYADVAGDVIELNIDKAKYYGIKVDDIARAQADINFQNEATKDAAEQMRITVETDFLANVPTAATTQLTRASVTKDNIVDYILDAGTALDVLNIPEDGRFLVLPPKYIQLVKQSRLGEVRITGDETSPMRNGLVGMVDRFKILSSNMVFSTGSADQQLHQCLAGHSKGACFASQFVKTETVRLESTFGDGIRGLKVYGYKVVVPDCLVNLKLKTGS